MHLERRRQAEVVERGWSQPADHSPHLSDGALRQIHRPLEIGARLRRARVIAARKGL